MKLFERIELAYKVAKEPEKIEAIVAKIESLGAILGRLESIEARLCANDTLLSLANRLEELNSVLRRIEKAESQPVQPVATTPQPVHNCAVVKDDLNEWHRLKLLSKFVALAGKAKEIEEEWQKVQQEEHNADFAFQTLKDDHSQQIFLYKKGIVDGIKWALNRSS